MRRLFIDECYREEQAKIRDPLMTADPDILVSPFTDDYTTQQEEREHGD